MMIKDYNLDKNVNAKNVINNAEKLYWKELLFNENDDNDKE